VYTVHNIFKVSSPEQANRTIFKRFKTTNNILTGSQKCKPDPNINTFTWANFQNSFISSLPTTDGSYLGASISLGLSAYHQL